MLNDNLAQQAQALFKAWFVDFEPFKDGGFVDDEDIFNLFLSGNKERRGYNKVKS